MWKPLIFLGAVNIPCLHPWSLKIITVLKELNRSISQPSISKQVAHIQFCHFSAKLRGLHWFFIHTAACSFLREKHGYIQNSLRNRIEVTQLQVIQIFFLKIQKINLRTKWAYFSFPGSKFQGVLETNFNNTITSKTSRFWSSKTNRATWPSLVDGARACSKHRQTWECWWVCLSWLFSALKLIWRTFFGN